MRAHSSAREEIRSRRPTVQAAKINLAARRAIGRTAGRARPRPRQSAGANSSAEGERIGLHVGVEKLDCERTIHDRPALAHQLVEPVVDHHAFAVGVDVGAVALARRGAVDRVAAKPAAAARSPTTISVGKPEPLLKDEITDPTPLFARRRIIEASLE